LHPVEGIHGDLGIVTKKDILLAISNSGETRELLPIISSVRHIGAPIISFTGVLSSTLGRNSDIVIDVSVEKEACPEKRKFNEKDFYKFHPGGNLGARLRAKVREVMIGSDQTPKVLTGTAVGRAIEEMDASNKGFVLITDRW